MAVNLKIVSQVVTSGTPGPAGKSAYQIAVDNGFQGTESEWLKEFHPFKGWFDSVSELEEEHSAPSVGEYAYVKGATSSDPVKIYECSTDNSWSDSGRTVDTSSVQTFGSGEAVNDVDITGNVSDIVENNDKLPTAGAVAIALGHAEFSTGEKIKDVGIDNTPTAESDNLVKSGGIYELLPTKITNYNTPSYTLGVIRDDGTIENDTSYAYTQPILLKPGDKLTTNATIWVGQNISALCLVDSDFPTQNTPPNGFIASIKNGGSTGYSEKIIYSNSTSTNKYVVICTYKNTLGYSIETIQELEPKGGATFATGEKVVDVEIKNDFNGGVDNVLSAECGKELKLMLDSSESQIEELDEKKIDKYEYNDVTDVLTYSSNRYIQYSSGKSIAAGASGLFKMFYFNIPTVDTDQIKAFLGIDGGIPAVIAFYSSTNFDPSRQFPSGSGIPDGEGGYKDAYYLKEYSIQGTAGTHWYEVSIPQNAKWVVIGNRGATLEEPQILIRKYADLVPQDIKDEINTSLKLASTGYALNPFIDAPYYAHIAANNFYITDGDYRGDFSPEGYNIGKWTIASQSIKDVEISARLGFKFIEANCQHTSDGYTICIHGSSGTFGQEVKSTDESVITTTSLRSTAINSKTLDWINTYVRYNSYYAKYQTKIPTLDEFCQACKRYNIGLFLGQATENDVKLAMRYMGNNLIVYNGPNNIRSYFDGYVVRWTDDTGKTSSDLLTEARTYGAPFICALGSNLANTLYNNNTLTNLVDDLHKEGFLICCTANYDTEARTRKYFEMGFDFSSSGHQVNPFESNYELFVLGNPKDAALPLGIVSTGTYSGGILTLSTDQTISCGLSDKIELGKGYLEIEYEGEITVDFGYRRQGGQYTERQNISSDGTKALIITDFFLWQTTQLVITATANTVVKSMLYKTSKC